MKRRRNIALVSSAALVAAFASSLAGASASGAATGGTVSLIGSHSEAAGSSKIIAAVPAATPVDLEVVLSPRDAAGVSALAQAVSDPSSAQFHHYLTASQWEAQFSPTPASVASVTSWLHAQGLTVGAISADRLSVETTGTAAQAEAAFGVKLNTYSVRGQAVQLAGNDATVPASLAGIVDGVTGLDQTLSTPDDTTGAGLPASTPAASTGATIPQPPGFRNPAACSSYYGQKIATTEPVYGEGYPNPLPVNPCGYIPQQFQSAYGLTSDYTSKVTGTGVTVAIIDAYASPTLLADAQKYYQRNDPSQPLASTQYSARVPSTFTNTTLCEASGWFGEQSLDVEAVHATAPGANILYVGAKSCLNQDLRDSMRTIVDGGLAQVVSDSYGDDAGDLLDTASDRSANDTLFMMAATTGITVQFSSGDSGDEFATTGLTSPDYPASSPWVTAVGGTSLAVTSNGSMGFQTGWSTSKSILCTTNYFNLGGCTKAELGEYLPAAPGGYDYGSGGGTSYHYTQPYYQAGVVPDALSEKNGSVKARVVPDIAMDADPTTGMLVGETQTFPDGVYYDQYRIGGTSLASPLMAGIVALADQAAGVPLGFLNPVIYKAASSGKATGFYDVTPQGHLGDIRFDYVDGIDNADGYVTSVRTLGYEGREQYCDGTGNCETRNVDINTAPGYDDMTGLGTPTTGFVTTLSKY